MRGTGGIGHRPQALSRARARAMNALKYALAFLAALLMLAGLALIAVLAVGFAVALWKSLT